MPRPFASPVVLGLSVFLWSCGASIPSNEQARKMVDATYANFKDPSVKIIDFTKQNGEMKEIEGQKVYTYHFLAAVEVPEGMAFRTAGLGGQLGLSKDPGPKDRNGWLGQFTPLPKGSIATRRGVITFRSTEKGWISANVPDDWQDGYCTELTSADACYKKLGWDKLN
jgi:hypothetical protein